jgi:hypothetical protein
MGIDVTHLVFETFGNANDHIVDDGSDGSDACNMFAVAMVDNKPELVVSDKPDFHVKMTKVLGEFTSWSVDSNDTRLNADSNALWDVKNIVFVQVFHGVYLEIYKKM